MNDLSIVSILYLFSFLACLFFPIFFYDNTDTETLVETFEVDERFYEVNVSVKFDVGMTLAYYLIVACFRALSISLLLFYLGIFVNWVRSKKTEEKQPNEEPLILKV